MLKVVWTSNAMYILLKEHPEHLDQMTGRTGLSCPGSVMTVFSLGGLGECPHTESLQIWPTEIEFGGNFE